MKCLRSLAIVLSSGLLIVGGYGQTTSTITTREVNYDGHSYKFLMVGSGIGQIFKDSKIVGSIVPDRNGGDRILVIGYTTPPPDIIAAYNIFKGNSQGAPAASEATNREQPQGKLVGPSSGGTSSAYDDGTKTVTFADGSQVAFVDAETLKLTIPGIMGSPTVYDVRYHGKNASAAFRNTYLGLVGQGASLSGSGVVFIIQSENKIAYDTAGPVRLAGNNPRRGTFLIHTVLQAADVANAAGHSYEGWQVLKSLRANNAGFK